MDRPIRFTPKECSLIQDTHFFRAKVVITEKVKQSWIDLREELKQELGDARLLVPEGVDYVTGQLVKGEHLNDFPYVYLDFPKFFSSTEKFTFRSLFWWGHQFVFALLLEGPHLDRYKANLLNAYDRLGGQGLYILMTETPWEWRDAPEYVLEIRKDNREAVAAALATRPFLKVHRFIPFDAPVLADGGLVREARATFRLMIPIVSA